MVSVTHVAVGVLAIIGKYKYSKATLRFIYTLMCYSGKTDGAVLLQIEGINSLLSTNFHMKAKCCNNENSINLL